MTPADYLRTVKDMIDTPQKYLGIGLVKAFENVPQTALMIVLRDLGYDPKLGEQQLSHAILMKAMDRAIRQAERP